MGEMRDHAAVQRTYDYVNTWPEELQGIFWSAVHAPTYAQSAEKTLAFATTLAHELAEKIRHAAAPAGADRRFVAYVNGWCDGRNEAADLIDPEVTP